MFIENVSPVLHVVPSNFNVSSFSSNGSSGNWHSLIKRACACFEQLQLQQVTLILAFHAPADMITAYADADLPLPFHQRVAATAPCRARAC
jgi:hypothetical protein